MRFYLPNEPADYLYLTSRLEQVPQIGSTIRFNRSDNTGILPGSFKVVDVIYDLEIVNQRIAKDNGHGGALVVLERIP